MNISVQQPTVEEAAAPALDIAAVIRACRAFRSITDEAASRLAAKASIRRYGDGETISAVGQRDDAEFLIVAEGAMTAAAVDCASGSMIVERYVAGDEHGLAVVLSSVAGGANAVLTADGDTAIAAIDGHDLEALLKDDYRLARSLISYFAEKSIDAASRVMTPETSARQRIHDAILQYVQFEDGAWRIRRMPRHREIAERAKVEETAAAAAVAALITSSVARREYPGLVISDIEELRRLAS